MTWLTDKKINTRRRIKVVAGGPVDKTRGKDMIQEVDDLAERIETKVATINGLPPDATGDFALPASQAGGAPAWAAGKQTLGSLVYNDGAVWRVKVNIANSQTAPTQAVGTTQYYEFVGAATLLSRLSDAEAGIDDLYDNVVPGLQGLLDQFKQTTVLFQLGQNAKGYATVQSAVNAIPTGGSGLILSTASGTEIVTIGLGRRVNLQMGQGTIAGLVMTGGQAIVRCNIVGAIVQGGGTLDFAGDITYTTTGNGQHALVLTAGRQKFRGSITLNSQFSSCQAIAMAGQTSVLDFDGSVMVKTKGQLLSLAAGTSLIRGRLHGYDLGGTLLNGFCDLYATLDTRESTSQAPALQIVQTSQFVFSQTLHSSCELLSAVGVSPLVRDDASGSFETIVKVIGRPSLTADPQEVTLEHVTPDTAGSGGTGGGGSTGIVRDPFDVPAAKRRAIVDANSPAVVETDEAYYGCEFVDEVYGPGKPAYYKCMPSGPATTGGATVWKWFRLDIL